MFDLWKLARIAIVTAFVAVAFAAAPASAQQASGTVVTDKSPTGELSFWNKIKDAPDASGFKIYLETFPNGMFYEVALAKFKLLGGNIADLKVVPQDKSGATNPSLKVKSLGTQKTQVFTTDSHVVFHKTPRRPQFHKAPRRQVMAQHKRIKRKKLLPVSPDPFAGGGGGGGGSGGGGGWQH